MIGRTEGGRESNTVAERVGIIDGVGGIFLRDGRNHIRKKTSDFGKDGQTAASIN